MDPLHTQHGLPESEAATEAHRLIAEAYRPEPQFPTSYRDDSLVPAYGSAPPVKQDDRRIVPAWATGIAVTAVGVGAGITGIGCGAWLVPHGLAAVTLTGVLMVTLPLTGAAILATAIGSAVSRARTAVSTHIYEGPVTYTENYNTSHQRGMFARAHNDIHR
ncbi:hypothetical protein [Streptomyces luteireticuli]|uniref:hypothetical protein n=1 Tax=Streptomyces luteireticuli TaxID=173858 RepID=UPI0035580048